MKQDRPHQRRMSQAERVARRRAFKERHLRDPQFPERTLCKGKVPLYPRSAFSPPVKGKPLCPICTKIQDDEKNLRENLPDAKARAEAKGAGRDRTPAEAERRKLRVRPAGMHHGLIDVQEARRFPSVQACGGGWRK